MTEVNVVYLCVCWCQLNSRKDQYRAQHVDLQFHRQLDVSVMA
jgi:hypothetical protein